MAKAMISSSFPIFLLAFSLLIFSISVETRSTPFRGVVEAGLELQCNKVYGVKNGDTCFDLEQKFKITTPHFSFINPNLNCTDLFIGQWLCLDAVLILP
ncbi:hypothetical protein Csa_003390 [Cucumis sativus]|uniref:LysM domain-containing protein n=1 Tax=Cucumis sativus TaxID=3659 RepID=A0A0A0KHZ8_CUCSA|nr:hypothetical protein Csa_003390 [Cucumis sativus]